jgi:hypothetical protein
LARLVVVQLIHLQMQPAEAIQHFQLSVLLVAEWEFPELEMALQAVQVQVARLTDQQELVQMVMLVDTLQ